MTLPRIGVFDSGVGGLTVLKAMAGQIPAHYFYFGDTARLPYGTKSAETVARYAIGATRFLEAQNIDLLVIACNTATALALPLIKEAAHVPVVGVVEPGAAMAAGGKHAARSHRHRYGGHRQQPCLSRRTATPWARSLRKGLPAVGPAGGRRMDRTPRHGTGGAHLSWRGDGPGFGPGGCVSARLHSLPAAHTNAAPRRSRPHADRGFRGIDCARGEGDDS